MTTAELHIRRLVHVRVAAGEDILESLREAVVQEKIDNGVILNGLGSCVSYHFHVVSSTGLPPQEAYPKGNGAYDIVAFSGLILGGRVHAHITFSDEKKAFGGHLELGCKALTFSMITIADVGAADLAGWDSYKTPG